MGLTTAARDLISQIIIGIASSTTTGWTALNAQTIVGDSTQAFGSSQNEAGTSGANRGNSSMDAGFPSSSGGANVATFRSTFGTAAANFAWNEIVIKNTSASSTATGQALCRFLATCMGTKTSAQSWQLTTSVTVTT